MRNILKAATLEISFPILSVEEGCILSKDADVTIGFKVFLRSCSRSLPQIMHPCTAHEQRQSQGTAELYDSTPPGLVSERKLQGRHAERRMSFLDRSFELHFNERPSQIISLTCFITKTTKERSRSQSNFSILCRGNIIRKEVRDKETVSLFLGRVSTSSSAS